MLSALAGCPDLAGVLPFASMFYGSPNTYLFYDERGIAHEVRQGEGGGGAGWPPDALLIRPRAA